MEDLHEAKDLEDGAFEINIEPQPGTSRALLSRNCKPENFHVSDERENDTEGDESEGDESEGDESEGEDSIRMYV